MGIEAEIHVKETGSIISCSESARFQDSFLVGDDVYSWRYNPELNQVNVYRLPITTLIDNYTNELLHSSVHDLHILGAELVAEIPEGAEFSQEVDLKEDVPTRLVIRNTSDSPSK